MTGLSYNRGSVVWELGRQSETRTDGVDIIKLMVMMHGMEWIEWQRNPSKERSTIRGLNQFADSGTLLRAAVLGTLLRRRRGRRVPGHDQ